MVNEVYNIITDLDNESLMKYFDRDLENFEATNSSNYLIANGLMVNPIDDLFLIELTNKLLSIINKDWKYVDYINFMKYEVGGRFKPHSDFIDTSTSANLEDLKKGGQREHTFLIYLNDDYEGGQTHFTLMNKTIKPEKNKIVWWKNTLNDGSQNIATTHESKKVISGTKYLVGIWVRHQPIYTTKTLL